jgi:hypothetical protein
MAAAVDQALLDLLPQIHALFSDPLRVVMELIPALVLPYDPVESQLRDCFLG